MNAVNTSRRLTRGELAAIGPIRPLLGNSPSPHHRLRPPFTAWTTHVVAVEKSSIQKHLPSLPNTLSVFVPHIVIPVPHYISLSHLHFAPLCPTRGPPPRRYGVALPSACPVLGRGRVPFAFLVAVGGMAWLSHTSLSYVHNVQWYAAVLYCIYFSLSLKV